MLWKTLQIALCITFDSECDSLTVSSVVTEAGHVQ